MKIHYIFAFSSILLALAGCEKNQEEAKTTSDQLSAEEVLPFPEPVSASVTVKTPTALKDARGDRTEYSPYLTDTYPDNVYFGDTHLHTSYSTDSGLFGNKIGPNEAYRFAKGELVTASHGVKARLLRPLDFLVVADHSENLGLAPMMEENNPLVLSNEWGRKATELYNAGDLFGAYTMYAEQVAKNEDPFDGDNSVLASMWERIIKAAEEHNNPGQFTAFIGFEWSSSPNASNLHRNVIFRDGGDKAGQILPISSYDSEDPEDLWAYIEKYEQSTGGNALAIAHNGNLSNGLMFDDITLTTKKPITRDYAERRMKAEPLYEVTQMKGDGEANPQLSPNDEFADFETWDKGSFGAAKEKGMIENEYTREAYKRGLQYEEKLGVNPFKFGQIGSTDSHTTLATSTEDQIFGKTSAAEPSSHPDRFDAVVTGYLPDPQGRDYTIRHKSTSASGLAAIWSRENTRESLWDSMNRKEVYATTGTRMKVRVFAGWDFQQADLNRADFSRYGYDNGVPMGGDLVSAKSGAAPRFLIQALRDPDWANLDRIQIIKGWTDAKGEAHERVYDVAVTGDREIGKDGRSKATVGNTVNVKEATFDNSIGEPILDAYWQDPDFNAKQRAFYYVRVLEIPTPRWTTYDAKHYKIALPDGVPTSIQERAYTSPIWYTPES
jgi:hypothetical protein